MKKWKIEFLWNETGEVLGTSYSRNWGTMLRLVKDWLKRNGAEEVNHNIDFKKCEVTVLVSGEF